MARLYSGTDIYEIKSQVSSPIFSRVPDGALDGFFQANRRSRSPGLVGKARRLQRSRAVSPRVRSIGNSLNSYSSHSL